MSHMHRYSLIGKIGNNLNPPKFMNSNTNSSVSALYNFKNMIDVRYVVIWKDTKSDWEVKTINYKAIYLVGLYFPVK